MMKRIVIFFTAVFLYACSTPGTSVIPVNNSDTATVKSAFSSQYERYRDGDIIFQVAENNMSKAIQLATNSKYSHVGIIFFRDKIPFVFQAASTVQATPLIAFINAGTGAHYVVKRIKKEKGEMHTSPEQLKQIFAEYNGKPYDNYFQWSDDAIYCSELVWKIYDKYYKTDLCALKSLKDFDLTSEEVKAKMHEKYGDHIPLNERVVAPSDIFDSPLLDEIDSN